MPESTQPRETIDRSARSGCRIGGGDGLHLGPGKANQQGTRTEPSGLLQAVTGRAGAQQCEASHQRWLGDGEVPGDQGTELCPTPVRGDGGPGAAAAAHPAVAMTAAPFTSIRIAAAFIACGAAGGGGHGAMSIGVRLSSPTTRYDTFFCVASVRRTSVERFARSWRLVSPRPRSSKVFRRARTTD